MARKIVIDNSNGEVRAAVIEDGKLADLFIERSRHPSVLGNIYKGKVENVLPGMQAAFVDIGLEKNAFLYVDDAMASLPDIVKSTRNGDEVELPMSRGKSIKELLKPGQEVLVQVTKEAIGTKGARVVTDVTLAGRYVVLIPSVNYVGVSRKIQEDSVRDRLRDLAHKVKPRGMGLIVRTVAEEQPDEEVVRDIEFLNRAWKKIRAKAARAKAPYLLHYDADLVYRMARDYFGDDVTEFTVNTPVDYNKVSDLLHIDEGEKDPRIRLYADKKPVFEAYAIEEEIWKATRRKVWLNSGGYLIFDTTEALTVIDVNTGKFTGSKDLADTAFRNNLEAAAELARQIRLRNIGGILIADFIDMESDDHKKRVLEELEKHLTKDKARTSVLGITKLGLIEMTRKKSQQGLVELTHRVCDVCDGRGKVISEETLALRAERLIKREAAATDMQALLIGLNPYVAGELSQDSSSAIKELEEQTMRDIFIKADATLGRDDVKVIAASSLEEILALVHPVKKGETIEVHIGQPNQERPDQGIALYKGLSIHIEDGATLVGKTLKVKISRVFKGYAKARVEGRHETRIEQRREEPEEDGIIIEMREPRRQQAVPAVPAPTLVKIELPEAANAPETEVLAGDAVSGQEAKKKRRRRRHRKNAKERAAMLVGLVAEGTVKADDMPLLAPEKVETPAETAVHDAKPEAAVLSTVDAGADPAMTASKKRRRRRHRSHKSAQATEGISLPGNEAGIGEAVSDKAMPPSSQLPVAPPLVQKAAITQMHSTGTTETVKAAAITASSATEGPRKGSPQQTRRPRASSQVTAKKAEKPANTAGPKQEAPVSGTAKAEVAAAPAQEKKVEAVAEAKPKRQYNRRKKTSDAGSKANSSVDTQAE